MVGLELGFWMDGMTILVEDISGHHGDFDAGLSGADLHGNRFLTQPPGSQMIQMLALQPPITGNAFVAHVAVRSEEHTSELQSRPHLVCRLLLEKKKKISTDIR